MKRSKHTHATARPHNRREWLRIGGLGCLGLSLPNLLAPRLSAASPSSLPAKSFGRAKSCIILFLGGGPPQHETFDPKPDAPIELRGDFKSIRTSVPGLKFCELLPDTARIAHKLTVIRSMTTGINAHAVSGYQMMTGRVHPAKVDRPVSPEDWPHIGSLVAALKPSQRSPLSAVTIPEPLVNNPGVAWPGQTGGFMGHSWDPRLFKCDPSAPDFRIDELTLPDNVSLDRLASRKGLIANLDSRLRKADKDGRLAGLETSRQQAFDMLSSSATRRAFELDRESPALRARYGPHKFGQSALLARRLVEAGVRLVQVNFPREPGDLSSPNPLWDTHRKNTDRLKTNLCPPFDRAFPALVNDLDERGLLDETLVVVMGEFGRSPKINTFGGRDHWGACFSIALAGAGLSGGNVIGASDRDGAYVKDRAVHASELSATIFHFLGIDPAGMFYDRLNRPLPIAESRPISELIG
jgi:hypothetical protein